jgi:hypothetical protein
MANSIEVDTVTNLICISFTANLAYCKAKRKMRDFSQEELETFIFVMQSKLGMMCGFVENKDTRAIKDYLPENVRLTKDYKKWLDSFPKEVENLMSMFKK